MGIVTLFSAPVAMFPVHNAPRAVALINVLTVDVESDMTVCDLKARVQDREGIPPDQQNFYFFGRRLKDEQTLTSYNIEHDSIINLELRLRGGKPVIYLLPPVEMDVSVVLTLVPQWSFSAIYPVAEAKERTLGNNGQVG